MYFKLKAEIKSQEDRDRFTYLLCKHPDSLFKKSFSKSSTVLGWYKEESSEILPLSYNIVVLNDNIDYIKRMKDANDMSYLSYQKDGVTPYQLNLIVDCLRSAITQVGYNEEWLEKSNEKFSTLICTIGSFPKYDKLIKFFEQLNFMVRSTENNDIYEEITLYKMNISLSTFLQQIFMVSLACTDIYGLYGRIEESKIDKYIRMSESWFNEIKDKDMLKWFIREITHCNKTYMKKYIEAVNFKEEESDSLKEELYIDYINLHNRLYKKVLDIIKKSNKNKNKKVILDYGCGNGKFASYMSRKIKNSTIFAVDSKRNKSVDKNWQFTFYQMNLLYPDLKWLPYAENLDLLILMEVIEHLETKGRGKLINIICNILQPKQFILTTPRANYNVYYESMKENEFRHLGHKIEFDDNTILELIDLIRKFDYEVVKTGIRDFKKIKEYSTFILVCNRKKKQYNKKLNRYRALYDSMYLPMNNYFASSKELSSGFSSKQFRLNDVKAIPFIQPTMAPVEYDDDYPNYLEYPMSAIKYYKNKDIDYKELCYENKMMGSNAQIIIFKNIEIANYFGLDKLIYVNSRNGFSFFREEDEGYESILYNEIVDKMEYDFYVFNGEMLPWSYKARGLIKNNFKMPLQVSENMNLFVQYNNINKFEEFRKINENVSYNLSNINFAKDSLSHYIQDSKIQYYIFDILACGNINLKKRRMDYINGFFINHVDKHSYIDRFKSNHIKIIKTNRLQNIDKIVSNWVQNCKNGLEGVVIKPLNKFVYMKNGYLIQPALKVRGQDYLRIIYGENYLEKDVFDIVKNRKIGFKRVQAIQQWEISHNILRAWLNKSRLEHERFVAFFIGNESINFANVDNTL